MIDRKKARRSSPCWLPARESLGGHEQPMLIAGGHVIEAECVEEAGRVPEKRLDPMIDQAFNLGGSQACDGASLAVLQESLADVVAVPGALLDSMGGAQAVPPLVVEEPFEETRLTYRSSTGSNTMGPISESFHPGRAGSS
jgi:hypothetical protein